MSLIPALRRWRQVYLCEFEVNLVYSFKSRAANAVQRNPGSLGTFFAEDLCVIFVAEREKRASQSAIFQQGTPMAVFSDALIWNLLSHSLALSVGGVLFPAVLMQSLKCLHNGAGFSLQLLCLTAHSHMNCVQVPFLTKMHSLSITLTGFTPFYLLIDLLFICLFIFAIVSIF